MKRLLVVIMCLALLFCLVACNGFMSTSKVEKFIADNGTPQAEMSIKYTINKQDIELRIVYNILLDKTPIASINFINLVNDGFYEEAVWDNYYSSLNYLVGARYKYDSEAGRYEELPSNKAFIGEFASNRYPEPNGGYAKFKTLSLAMYHGDTANDFNSANGALILAASSQTLQSSNYAVFAEMVEVQVYKDNNFIQRYDQQHLSGDIIAQLTQASVTSRTVTLTNGSTASRNILGDSKVTRYVMSVKMLGENIDWSKLPKVD